MAYTPFDNTKPDGASQNGAAFASSIRTNQAALRDGAVMLTFRGWNVTVDPTGTDYTTPSAWVYQNGQEYIKMRPTRILSGITSGMVSKMLFIYSSNAAVTYTTVGIEKYTYDANANFVSSHWSL